MGECVLENMQYSTFIDTRCVWGVCIVVVMLGESGLGANA